MTVSLQNISQEQVDALKQQSQAAYDAQVKSRQALVSQRPALQAALEQEAHPQSLCGCGCQQVIAGYFCFESCGCSCSCVPQTETIQISANLADIGPNAPATGTMVRFTGQVTGKGTAINIRDVYLQGTVVDAENVIGVPLTVELSIESGTLIMSLVEGTRLIATLVHPAQYQANITGQFYGFGSGVFQPA
ncbi:TPA: hypothetical protein QDB03_005878 [Burkholderia vietnamiensis]|nr:hypothetical protein [Burkholderia vietnamiensis]HDR9064191.1 hypothetical protein [Burkholderia vietnamiensis]HDR9158907.1 hypothetical protein [Burkholderia vietnamiensis]